MKTSILFLSLMLTLPTWAVSGKVTKVKGKSAIVTFDGPVAAGDFVSVGGLDDTLDSDRPEGSKHARRDYAFQYSWLTQILNTTSGNSTVAQTSHGGSLAFWVVLGQFEVAPVLKYATTSSGSSSASSTTLGLIGQYDFVKNRPGVQFVPAVYVRYSNTNDAATVGSISTNVPSNILGAGGALDWFPFGEHVALTFTVEYLSITYPNNTTLTANAWQLGSGAKVYF